jgi:hypothetical protein
MPWLGGDTLTRQLQYLKAENQILRSRLPKKLSVTAQERQTLLRYGAPPGAAIKELISIVTPDAKGGSGLAPSDSVPGSRANRADSRQRIERWGIPLHSFASVRKALVQDEPGKPRPPPAYPTAPAPSPAHENRHPPFFCRACSSSSFAFASCGSSRAAFPR